jgi:hypothetical protein
MKRLVVTVTVSLLVLMLSSWIPPAQAASVEGALASETGPTFHALSQMPAEARGSLTPLSDAELESVVGAAGLFGAGGLIANLGIVVQINVCAVCAGVNQSNFGFLGQNIRWLSAR